MLVINGFFENGVFTPETPLSGIKGRQKAVLNIEGAGEIERLERINSWREFSQAVRNCNEVLEGEPQRIRFNTPEEIDAYEIRA